ncbi:20732_t:CDS:2 [Funneliformis geosporum]|uniref:4557_t:CDS:1 n=1 Tax=Funneliformis geosporum TaxID=1117311 RepID=A0A9W4SG67_9GLOM|nr:4557_t:CDS:2 [Funneliformis geosporum]CAI2169868.1 20732_t:CDS:2 [Funneliformis geosporum]
MSSSNPDIENGKIVKIKKYPFEEKNKWNRRKAIVMTLCQIVSLIFTFITFYYYYRYYTTGEIYIIYKVTNLEIETDDDSRFSFIEFFGILIGGPDFYFWLGKHRGKIEKKYIDRLGYIMDALQVIKLVLLLVIMFKLIYSDDNDVRKRTVVYKKLALSIFIIACLVLMARSVDGLSEYQISG